MKTDDIINVNYTTEKHNMLIFAHTGVMKNHEKYVFIIHFPLILGQILFFSSTNHKKAGAQETRKKGKIFTCTAHPQKTPPKNQGGQEVEDNYLNCVAYFIFRKPS